MSWRHCRIFVERLCLWKCLMSTKKDNYDFFVHFFIYLRNFYIAYLLDNSVVLNISCLFNFLVIYFFFWEFSYYWIAFSLHFNMFFWHILYWFSLSCNVILLFSIYIYKFTLFLSILSYNLCLDITSIPVFVLLNPWRTVCQNRIILY